MNVTDSGRRKEEQAFVLPSQGSYPRPYDLKFHTVGPFGMEEVCIEEMMTNFHHRNGFKGMRCYKTKRLRSRNQPWNDSKTVVDLFWKEYVRYFIQFNYQVSNNDIDFFLVSKSRKAYPVEFKRKSAAQDKNIGEWFGLDTGTFVKLSYFITAGNNMDALFIIEEVYSAGDHLDWLAIKFSELVKNCSWVTNEGGKGMTGSSSNTVKIPKAAFSELDQLLISL